MSADPAMADGLNWYRYAGNNPIMYSDPTGLMMINHNMSALNGKRSKPPSDGENSNNGENSDESSDEENSSSSEGENNSSTSSSEESNQRVGGGGAMYAYSQHLLREQAKSALLDARRWHSFFESAQTDKERAYIATFAREQVAKLNPEVILMMINMSYADGEFMDQAFRDMLNTSDHGGEWRWSDVFDAHGELLEGWFLLRKSESKYHIMPGYFDTMKLVHKSGREVIFAQKIEGGSWELVGSSLHRKPGIIEDSKRGTFNYSNHIVTNGWLSGWFHPGGTWYHWHLDMDPWKRFEPEENRKFW